MKLPRSNLIRRLKIVEGQVHGLQDMVLKSAYCMDIITQTSAIKHALSAIEDSLMEAHLSERVLHQTTSGQATVKEVLKVYRIKGK